jgi:hypothetical protein
MQRVPIELWKLSHGETIFQARPDSLHGLLKLPIALSKLFNSPCQQATDGSGLSGGENASLLDGSLAQPQSDVLLLVV